MFTLTSTSTKITALAFSTLAAFGSMDSVALGFQHPGQTTNVVTLPAVTVVGHRTESMQDTVQTAAKADGNSAI
jgi:hypothetical protein